jgi:hypothetical protein
MRIKKAFRKLRRREIWGNGSKYKEKEIKIWAYILRGVRVLLFF